MPLRCDNHLFYIIKSILKEYYSNVNLRSEVTKIEALFLLELNRYGITPGADIDQAKKNGGQAKRPQHQGVVADFKIIKKV
jgi:hypothetical protein